jgi:branched-chain amino acid aminotransferase
VFMGEPNIIFAYWLNRVRVAVAAFAWSGYSDRSREAGTSAKIAPYVRPKAHAELFKAKLCGHYVLSNLAFGDAARSGFKQAIFLDEDGVVCESTGENVFLVRDRELWTPPPSRSILIGITRLSVMEIAAGLGYEVIERDFRVDDLRAAGEVFTTGTASELLPICSIEGQEIGSGRLGPVTRAIQDRFTDIVKGRVPEYRRWLTPVALPAVPVTA